MSLCLPGFLAERSDDLLTSFKKYELFESVGVSRDSDVEVFLMTGYVSDGLLERNLLSSDEEGAPLLIRRSILNDVIDVAATEGHVAIISDFGNGKTIFLRCLAILLTQKGNDVYVVDAPDEYNREDLEILGKSGRRSFLIIDDYDQHKDFLAHFSDLFPGNITLIVAARATKHDRMQEFLGDHGIGFHEFFVDELDDVEAEYFSGVVDNVGLWSDYATLSLKQKVSVIKNKYRGQLQQTLLGIFQAPQMLNRVKEIINPLVAKKNYKDTIFAICVLSVLGYKIKLSLVSELAGNDDIYKTELRNNESFRSILRIRSDVAIVRSSVFCLSLLRNFFVPTYIVDQLLFIAKKMNENSGDEQQRDILKSLLRFSGVERLFPERQRVNNLVKYYEEVKRVVPWLKTDPHFWLQYGMALLAYDDYPKSQRMLDQAYEWAAKKENYHTLHIDMQQSRLYMKIAVKEESPAQSFSNFEKGVVFFKYVADDVEKYKSLENIYPIFSYKFDGYTKNKKIEFIRICEKLLVDMEAFCNRDDTQRGRGKLNARLKLDQVREKMQGLIDRGIEAVGQSS